MFPQIKQRLARWLVPTSSSDTRSERTDIEQALASRKELDRRVVDAVLKIPREEFVPAQDRDRAQEDRALSIGNGQTISQPSLVAHMVSNLQLAKNNGRVLDVGCGSGYQAAVLSFLTREVITVERIRALANAARSRLTRLGYANVQVIDASEDYLGYPEGGQYDAIIVGAAVPKVPEALIAQLKTGGRMVIPVGQIRRQRVTTVVKCSNGIKVNYGIDCVFVPLIGPEAW